jgi:hypothetical protein
VSALDEIFTKVATEFIGRLPEKAVQRIAALAAARGVMPDADVYDRIRLARYILTGFEDPPEVDTVMTASGEVVGVFAREDRVEAVEDLGPLAPDPMDEVEADDEEDPPWMTAPETSPMAGAHWRGRRGDRSG